MIDHISLRVKHYAKAKPFYLAALKPLGYEMVMEFDGSGGMGIAGKPDLWLSEDEHAKATHVAFAAENRAAVDAFYTAAMAAGGKDNGKPGIRKDYHPNYYAAYVHDMDGNNIEVVCHRAE